MTRGRMGIHGMRCGRLILTKSEVVFLKTTTFLKSHPSFWWPTIEMQSATVAEIVTTQYPTQCCRYRVFCGNGTFPQRMHEFSKKKHWMGSGGFSVLFSRMKKNILAVQSFFRIVAVLFSYVRIHDPHFRGQMSSYLNPFSIVRNSTVRIRKLQF